MNRRIFIDCGGYDGCSVRKFLDKHKESAFEIFSFEPNPELWKYYNDIRKHCTLIKKAVWISDGQVWFYLDTKDYDGSSMLRWKKNIFKPRKIKVPTVDLSRWILESFDNNDTIILKLDIEGSEYRVLKKMISDGSIGYIKHLYIEFHARKARILRRTHRKLEKSLADRGLLPEEWNAIHEPYTRCR